MKDSISVPSQIDFSEKVRQGPVQVYFLGPYSLKSNFLCMLNVLFYVKKSKFCICVSSAQTITLLELQFLKLKYIGYKINNTGSM